MKQLGFTLVEILVVVLMIGILASIAVPSYNRAVEKARGVEVLNALTALDKALGAYYLSNGTYIGATGRTLDITIPTLKYHTFSNRGFPEALWNHPEGTVQIGTGFSDFFKSSGTFEVGSTWPTEASFRIIISSNQTNDGQTFEYGSQFQNYSIYTDWENGTLKRRVCKDSYDIRMSAHCPHVFNCKSYSDREITFGTGGGSGRYEGGECEF